MGKIKKINQIAKFSACKWSLLLIAALLSLSCSNQFSASTNQQSSQTNEQLTIDTDKVNNPNSPDSPSPVQNVNTAPTARPQPVFNPANTLDQQVNRALVLENKPSPLKRPLNLSKCLGLSSYTSHFGCTESLAYTSISGKKLFATADVKIFYHDPVKKNLDRVAYLIAPHSFGNPKSIHQELKNIDELGTRKVFKRLAEKGLSVVYIAYGNKQHAGQVVRVKALVAAQIIKKINQLKSSKEASFLMGMSMGGVIARVALKNLERTGTNEHNINHYVSMDSPHRGAHIPMGLQHILPFLERGTEAAVRKSSQFKSTFGGFIENILNMDELIDQLNQGIEAGKYISSQIELFGNEYLNSAFAQELIIQQIKASQSSGYTQPSYKALQNYLNTLGMPKMTKSNIGIANGAGGGQALNLKGNFYVALDTAKRNYVEIDFASFITKKENTLFRGVYKYPDPKEIAGDKIFGSGGGTDTFGYTVATNQQMINLDTIPCATISAVGDLEKYVTQSLAQLFPEKIKIGNSRACFIPTTSALALTKPINYRGFVTAQDSLFDEVITENINSRHLYFSPKITEEIIKIIDRSY